MTDNFKHLNKQQYFSKYLFYAKDLEFYNKNLFKKDIKNLVTSFKNKYHEEINYFIAKKGV